MNTHAPKIFSEGWFDYELIDAGGNKKLERWGKIITIRPERNAYFHSGLPFSEWTKMAHFEFIEISTTKGKWKQLKKAPREWNISYEELNFHLSLTSFKHLGLFPEQRANWDFISESLPENGKMLNLFAYTGASSLAAKKVGAEVLHVDAVKQLIDWSKTNQEASGLTDIKWVLEDALKFAQREVKRGKQYNLIQMDPPAFGLGAKGEKWKLEQKIDALISSAADLLAPGGWLILNTYSPKVDLELLEELTQIYFRKKPEIAGGLWMKTRTEKELFYGDLIRIQK